VRDSKEKKKIEKKNEAKLSTEIEREEEKKSQTCLEHAL
jgi:hypothetical protein